MDDMIGYDVTVYIRDAVVRAYMSVLEAMNCAGEMRANRYGRGTDPYNRPEVYIDATIANLITLRSRLAVAEALDEEAHHAKDTT